MKINFQISSLQASLAHTQFGSHSHVVNQKQPHQLTTLQKVTLVATVAFVILGVALFCIGKPLVGATIAIAAFGIGYYFYSCLIFNPGPLPLRSYV